MADTDASSERAVAQSAEADPVRKVGLLFAKQLQIEPLAVGQRRGEAFYTADHLTGKTSLNERTARPIDAEALAASSPAPSRRR